MDPNLADLYRNLTIIPVGGPSWQQQVFAKIGAGEPATLAPLEVVLEVAQSLGAKSLVVEDEYIDSDFLDEFQCYYCRSFRKYPSRCQRLHFFAARLKRADLPDLTVHKEAYLGYSVVRPLSSFRTGRTVLASPLHDGDSTFTLCRAEFDANLSGAALKVCGTPFIQQDTNVGVCAQAALWVTGLYMHAKYAYPRFMPSEITQAATRTFTLGPVREGLAPWQMAAALREMAYSPLVFPHYDADLTARLIYSYVESEIPVIVTLDLPPRGGHAIVVVGHDFNVRSSPSPDWVSNVHWIDHFFAQDDAQGPYRRISIWRRPKEVSVEKNAAYILVPAPEELAMRVDDVLLHIETLRDNLNALIDLFAAQDFRFSAFELQGLVFRVYLRRSNDFKRELSPGMSELLRHVYKSMPMPRYVWVAEILTAEYLNRPRSADRKMVGEMLIDSTADRHARLGSYLAVHLLGRMVVKSPEEELPLNLYIDPAEKPYGHLVRR